MLGEDPARWPVAALRRKNKDAVKAAKALLGAARFARFKALAALLRSRLGCNPHTPGAHTPGAHTRGATMRESHHNMSGDVACTR